jgi:hypothetical protein
MKQNYKKKKKKKKKEGQSSNRTNRRQNLSELKDEMVFKEKPKNY